MATNTPQHDYSSFHTMRGNFGSVLTVAFSPQGTLVAYGTSEGVLRIESLRDDGDLLLDIKLRSAVTSLIWNPDQARTSLFAGEVNGHIHRVAYVPSGSPFMDSYGEGQGSPINALVIEQESKILIAAAGGMICFYNLEQQGDAEVNLGDSI
ncbi:hypothetical protein VKT23_019183 [Stygiomarasmius scandens]|uniref:Anaphase-promoting complex subunit 4 WD40 domain-containing protein n=1 Tax=Marasmiellus scandens TaxID=2682957 RepID=A0ABR1IQ23_9AGAR